MPDTYTELYVEPAATNASNINGGSSRDRKFQRTNGNWNSSTRVFTATGDSLSTAWIGEVACVIADGGTTGAYFAVVTAVDNTAKTITLSSSRVVGSAPSTSATGRTITIGGAWTGMSGATTFPFSITTWHSLKDTSTRVRINLCGSFSVTSALTNNSASVPLRGFLTTPGDGGFATIAYTGNSNTSAMMCSGSAYTSEIESIWFKNQTTSATASLSHGLYFTPASGVGFCIIRKCRFSDCVGAGLSVSGGTSIPFTCVIDCEFFDCAKSSIASGGEAACRIVTESAYVKRCTFHDNTAATCRSALYPEKGTAVSECVFENNTIGVEARSSICVENSAFYGNTTAVKTTNGASDYHALIEMCCFENNTTVIDMNSSTAGRLGLLYKSAFYNNATVLSTNATASGWANLEAFNLSQSPFVDAANGDFRTRLTPLRNAIDGTLLQSSDYYSKATRRRVDIGIGPSDPHYNGQ